MKDSNPLRTLACCILHSAFCLSVGAQTTALTYQGSLSDNGGPASGIYDLRFALYDSPTNGVEVSVLTNAATLITDGLFTSTLDFGPGVFDGTDRWLEIGAMTNGGGPFSTLSPRQQITSTPYALRASQAGSALSMSNPLFLGTEDASPLILSVNDQAALRLEYPTAGSVPNLVGGYSGNSVGAGTEGAVIAGGGASLGKKNTIGVESDYSAIGGGQNNNIADNSGHATIAGGVGNDIGVNADYSAIGGGYVNSIASNAWYAVIPGGYLNAVGAGATNAFAAGNRAKANHPGALVWADSTDADFASTANNQFLIRAVGGVGIGTAAPGERLHVAGGVLTDGNSARLRLQRTTGANYLDFNNGQPMNFRSIAPDDAAANIRMTIATNGNVGIGTSTPGYRLQLSVDSAGKPNGGSWANSSDARLKTNIRPLAGALDKLIQLRGVTFEWRNPEDHANQTGPQGGFIAQEVAAVFPNWVTEVQAAERDHALTDDGKIQSLSLPFEFDALVVEAIKEQQQQIQARDVQIAALKARLDKLERLLEPQLAGGAR